MRNRTMVLSIALLLVGCVTGLFAGGAQEGSAAVQPVLLEVRASQPEYMAKEQQLWDVFESKNPGIKIKLFALNETEDEAFKARIAAGDPPGFSAMAFAQTLSEAEQLTDLKTVDFKWWGNFTYDAKSAWKSKYGLDKVPILQWSSGPLASFIYYKDEMAKAGLDPTTIRTWADLDAFLAKLKGYVDTRSDLKYVIATGWHVWCWPLQFMHHFIVSFDPQAQAKAADLYTGKAKWTDLAKNPYAPAFAKLKEWYDKGYLPKEFWTMSWEEDFEASFIGRKAILTFHGPWLWDKVEAADPTAQLAGFPLPANSAGKIQYFPPQIDQGPGIYKDVQKKPEVFNAAVTALNFMFSPEGVKMLSESLGLVAAYDLSSVGGANLQSAQYLTVIKPVIDGKYGKASWDMSPFGPDAGARFYIEGRPNPAFSDPLNALWASFFSGNIDMAGLMKSYQEMFDNAYKIK